MKKALTLCTKKMSGLLSKEFIRFIIIGGVNTFLGYSVTLILFYIIGLDYKAAQILNFIICFPVAYTMQTLYAFQKRWSWKRLFIYPISSLPNFILQFVTLVISVEIFGIVEYIAYLISYTVPIPIMFFVVKFLVTPNEGEKSGQSITAPRILPYIGMYTIFFCIVFFLGFERFLFENGKSFIWYLDGVKQHFPFLYDFAEILKSVLSGASGFPMWNWQLGLGADTIISYSYYVLGDILSILAGLFFPLDYMELAYSILVGFRLYLVGFSLLCYCKYMGLKKMPSVVGSLMYAFSGHILFWGIRHPFFINGAIILPFLAIGIEEIFKKNKPTIFILSIAVSAINNFYFFYMNSLGIFVYAVVRFFYYIEKDRLKVFIKMFFRVVLYYLAGLSIGAFIFIPSAYGFLNTARVPSMEIDFFSSLRNYLKIFVRFIINDKYPRISLPLIAFPCAALFLHFKSRLSKSYKALFLIFTAFVCLPIVYYAFNAMSARNDRWVYIYIFILSFVVSYALNYIEEYKDEWKLFIGLFGILGAIHYKVSISSLIIILLGIYFLYKGTQKDKLLQHKKYFQVGILLLVSLNLIGNIDTLMKLNNYGGKFKDYGAVMEEYQEDKTAAASNIEDTDIYRIGYDGYTDNRSVVNNFNGTHVYNSIIDKNLIAFYEDHNLRLKPTNSAYMGLDNISSLNSLLSVKYYIANEENKDTPPYGFKEINSSEGATVYENENVLPIGFIYDSYTIKDELKEMPSVEAIYAMMSSAVVEEDIPGILKENHEDWSQSLSYELIREDGAKLKSDEEIQITEEDGSITLGINGDYNQEIFLNLKRIYYENNGRSFEITVETDQVSKSKETRSISNNYYFDNRDYLYNLGVPNDKEKLEVTISFSRKGKYDFDSIEILGVPIDRYENQIDNLKTNTLEDVEINNNEIIGSIQSANRSILFLSILYTKGWDLYIDGEQADTFLVNTAFTGAIIEPGEHEIYLKYTTPYLKTGGILSLIGVISLIAIRMTTRK